MIYLLEVINSRQVTPRNLARLNCESHLLCNGTIQTVIIILHGRIPRSFCSTRPSPNGRHAGRFEETSSVDDSLCHLRASVSFNSQVQCIVSSCVRTHF